MITIVCGDAYIDLPTYIQYLRPSTIPNCTPLLSPWRGRTRTYSPAINYLLTFGSNLTNLFRQGSFPTAQNIGSPFPLRKPRIIHSITYFFYYEYYYKYYDYFQYYNYN